MKSGNQLPAKEDSAHYAKADPHREEYKTSRTDDSDDNSSCRSGDVGGEDSLRFLCTCMGGVSIRSPNLVPSGGQPLRSQSDGRGRIKIKDEGKKSRSEQSFNFKTASKRCSFG